MSGTVPALGDTDPRRITQAIRELFQGRSNAVGMVTLEPEGDNPVTSTTVKAVNCSPSCKVFLFPASADAAAEFVGGSLYIDPDDVIKGQFTIQHANDTSTDRVFFWVCLG